MSKANIPSRIGTLEKSDPARLEIREKIIEFERFLDGQENVVHGDSQLCPLKHSFAEGIYVREIFIPKGTILTGKIHKHRHPNFLMSGTVEVVTEGRGPEILQGPLVMVSEGGTKRALRAISDLHWVTVHLNLSDTQDLAKIEKYVIAKDYEEYEKFRKLQDNPVMKFLNKVKLKLLSR